MAKLTVELPCGPAVHGCRATLSALLAQRVDTQQVDGRGFTAVQVLVQRYLSEQYRPQEQEASALSAPNRPRAGESRFVN